MSLPTFSSVMCYCCFSTQAVQVAYGAQQARAEDVIIAHGRRLNGSPYVQIFDYAAKYFVQGLKHSISDQAYLINT